MSDLPDDKFLNTPLHQVKTHVIRNVRLFNSPLQLNAGVSLPYLATPGLVINFPLKYLQEQF